MRIIVVSNSHIDPVWLWDKYEGIDEVVNTFKSACDRLDENPRLTFTASSTCFYRWVEELVPELFERIRKHIKTGRWEVAGAWWVEGDTNLPLRESFVESARTSRAFLKDRFQVDPKVSFSPDTFGHPACLPSILKDTGFDSYVFSRPGIHEKPDLPSDLFWWKADGQRVLCYRLPNYYSGSAEALRKSIDDERFCRHGLALFLFGVGDHGGGPTKKEIADIEKVMTERTDVDVEYGSLEGFFREAQELGDLPEVEGDLHYHAVGCYSVNRDIKQGVRLAEQALSYARRCGADGLDDLWQTTLFNEFHDILPGSCSPEAAHQATRELGGVTVSAEAIAYRALKNLSAEIPVESPEGEFRIYNTLPFDVVGPIEIESFMYFRPGAKLIDELGREVPYQQIQPSVRCANRRWLLVDMLPSRQFKRYRFDTPVEPNEIPNFRYGEMAQCGDFRVVKPGQVFFKGQPLFAKEPVLSIIDDETDTWSHGVEGYGEASARFRLESSSVQEGPLVAFYNQELDFERSSATMTFKLYRDLPYFDLDVFVRWEELRRILKLELFPCTSFESWSVQGAVGSIDKRTNRREEPLHGWLTASDMRVLQDGAFAVDRFDDRIRVTLVRSSWYGYHDPYQLDPFAPMEPTDLGKHAFRFRFFTEAVDLDLAHRAFIEPFKVIRENR